MDLNRYIVYHMDDVKPTMLRNKLRLWHQQSPPGELKRKIRGLLNHMGRKSIVKVCLTIATLLKQTCEIQDIHTLECERVIEAGRFVVPKNILRSAIMWQGVNNYGITPKKQIKNKKQLQNI